VRAGNTVRGARAAAGALLSRLRLGAVLARCSLLRAAVRIQKQMYFLL
jgi:hypothetical protein